MNNRPKLINPACADRAFRLVAAASALLVLVLLAALLIQLGIGSAPAWREFGPGFLVGTEWDPVRNVYGALPAIVGTLLTTALALLLAVPPAFVTALWLVDAPAGIGEVLSQALDLLAAIPSVIYGMWGLFILVPVMQDYVQPFLSDTLRLGRLPFFGEYGNGFGVLTAGLIPRAHDSALYVGGHAECLSDDAADAAGVGLRRRLHALGDREGHHPALRRPRASRRNLHRLGRALGETMAVLFVIGNIVELPENLYASGTTIAATLANNFAEADGIMRAVLFALGLILLVLALGVQILAQYYLVMTGAKRGEN